MNSVIIAAGGSGERMQSNQLKQFALLNNKPVIIHTIEQFLNFDKNIELIIALNDSHKADFLALSKCLNHFNLKITSAGENRFKSVKNALKSCHGEFIAVHDAVRPLISRQLIEKCFREAQNYQNAIPCLPPTDSLRKLNKRENTTVNRKEYLLTQTPQVFASEQLKNAYKQDYSPLFTDDASVVEQLGYKIHLIEGERQNIKITYANDLKIAEVLLNS